MAAPRVRNVVFTVNAEEGHPLRLLDLTHPTWVHVKYCVYQREMANHEHFQGYLELDTPMTYDALHQFEGLDRAHFERRRGTAKQADHYCRKPMAACDCAACQAEIASPTRLEGPWSIGEMSHQGQRADLLEVKRELDRGTPLKRIADDFFPEWVRFGKSFAEFKRQHTNPRDFKSICIVLCGPSGTGKSRTLTRLAHYLGTVFVTPAKKGSGLYFDDYDGQDVLLIDEFDGSNMPPTFFNLLVDRYQCTLPCHGSAGHQMVSKFVLIGTNYHPKFWWKNRSAVQRVQTLRRIEVLVPMLHRLQPFIHADFQVFGPNINRE